jgi:hypothetical protein
LSQPSPDASSSTQQPNPWSIAGWAVVVGAFLVGFANYPLRVVGSHFDYLPGDAGDNRLNNFILEHGYRCLAGLSESFWDAPMFYPAPRVTAYSDAHFGMLPVYATARALGLSPESAFQAHFLIACVLNFAAAVWALRRIGFGPVGTAAGAYVFAFSLAVVSQTAHEQLVPRFLAPLAFVLAWEFLRFPQTWRFAALAGCCVGQLYLTVYIGYFLVLLLTSALLVALIRFHRELQWAELLRPGRWVWAGRLAVVLTAGLASMLLLSVHARGTGVMPLVVVRNIAPLPGAWLTTPPPAWAFPELAEATGLGLDRVNEQQLFPGVIPFLAIVFGLFAVIRPGRFGGTGSLIAVSSVASLILVAMVTRWGNVWPYEFLGHIPGLANIRAVGRVVLVLLFPAGIVVAALGDWVVRQAGKFGRLSGCLAALLLLGGVVADQWLTSTSGSREKDWQLLRYSKELALARQARLTETIRRHPKPKLVYVFPSRSEGPNEQVRVHLESMRVCQDLGLPCINGYNGYVPVLWDDFTNYRKLMTWLTVSNSVPPDQLAGLVVVGDPEPDSDPQYEAAMRAAYPPQPVK